MRSNRLVPQRLDLSENICQFIGGAFKIILRLNIHPEGRRGPEVAGEPQGCVSSDGSLLTG
jgi:hypothetical protein